MVPVDATDCTTVAVAGVIHQDVDPELGEVPDLEGYCQREGVRDVKLGDELPEDQQRVLKDLVRRYPDVFTDMPGETDVIQHQIRLTDDTPIRCKPYPLPYAMREELRNEVDTMLEMGVVRLSTSPYASPIVMVNKKDGSNRVCVDFRKLNKIPDMDPEPMTTAEDLFQRLSGKKYLSKIDLTKGLNKKHTSNRIKRHTNKHPGKPIYFPCCKEAESKPDKMESTSNNVQVRKKQQHRRRACDLLASLKRFYSRIPMCLNRPLWHKNIIRQPE